MECVGIIIKKNSLLALKTIDTIYSYLVEKNITVYLDKNMFADLNMKNIVYIDEYEMEKYIDLLLVLGGDGTFLHSSSLIVNKDIPILGVNLGSLGFLTETLIEEFITTMDKILLKQYSFEYRSRLMIHIHYKNGTKKEQEVLNDISINCGHIARIIDIDVFMDSSKITSYRSDGLIVSTPTGSTAYSLSAGGPIVYPTLDVLIITPICPHTLTMRPIVLPSSANIKIYVKKASNDIFLTMDGQKSVEISNEVDFIQVKKSENRLKVITSEKRDYFEILREKLKWSGSPLEEKKQY